MEQATISEASQEDAHYVHARGLTGWCDGCGKEDALQYSHTRVDYNTGEIMTDPPVEHFCSDCVPIYRKSNDAHIQLHLLITHLVRAWARQALQEGVDDIQFTAEMIVGIGVRQAMAEAERT